MKKIILLAVVLPMICGFAMNVNAQSINLKAGLFYPTLQSDLWESNLENLEFAKQDMLAGYYALEYEQFLSRHFSFSIEGSYYQKEHNSMYRDYEYQNGDAIYQSLSLETTALEVGFKVYPFGHQTTFYPYLGVSGGVCYWKYEQWGDFIDFENNTVDENQYLESSTYTPGMSAKAGFVFRPTRSLGIGFEGRYQSYKGPLSFFVDFEKLDLSGFSATVGLHWFF